MDASADNGAFPLIAVVADREWIDQAICGSHAHLFFGSFRERPGTRRRREARAKRMCARCPVQDVCREAGRRNHESGVWGGETDEERARAGYPPRGVARRSVAEARREGRPPGDESPDLSGDEAA